MTGAVHGRPTAAELVAAVREFLEADVMEATEGRVRFHARVAANALAMVERELAAGETHAAAQREALAGLGVADEPELAAAIRAGTLDHRLDEVTDVVRQSVRAKLDVAHPDYE